MLEKPLFGEESEASEAASVQATLNEQIHMIFLVFLFVENFLYTLVLLLVPVRYTLRSYGTVTVWVEANQVCLNEESVFLL